jgi:hypothetical protein
MFIKIIFNYQGERTRCRRPSSDKRKSSSSSRYWNALPESVIEATRVNSFKNRLNNHKFVPDFYEAEAGIS